MLIVAAVGGNALLRRGEPMDAARQAANAKRAAAAISALVPGNQLIVTHGNGPQVGLLALETGSNSASGPYPLDVLGAESQGMVGYLLETALRNALPERTVCGVLSQVLVDADDPAFGQPTKPIGPYYTADEAERLRCRGWTFSQQGSGYRRVVPSPEPRALLELPALEALLAAGVVTISAGGGGVPVVRSDRGELSGVEAVVDKDLTAALLAIRLHADALLLLTDVAAVQDQWGSSAARGIRCASVGWFRKRTWAPGSMAPKILAATRFVEACGGIASIGSLDEAPAILTGQAGTRVGAAPCAAEFWGTAND